MKRTIFLDSSAKIGECSPFSLEGNKMKTSRNLHYTEKETKENKEFAAKVQNMKNSICLTLEEKQQTLQSEPIKIMK